MTDRDFAGNCALEAAHRAARIVPVAQTYCAEEGYPLTELQMIALCSVILSAFDGLTDTLERMVDINDVLRGLTVGEQAEAWLRDKDGPLQ